METNCETKSCIICGASGDKTVHSGSVRDCDRKWDDPFRKCLILSVLWKKFPILHSVGKNVVSDGLLIANLLDDYSFWRNDFFGNKTLVSF